MADRENRDYDDAEGSLDPELLYTKEYCIGWAITGETRASTPADTFNRRWQLWEGLQGVRYWLSLWPLAPYTDVTQG